MACCGTGDRAGDRSVDSDTFSRKALYTLLGNPQEIRQNHNQKLTIQRIIGNQFQDRVRLPQQIVDELK